MVLEGKDTLQELEKRKSSDPRDPEPLIKLGLKYQARQNREKALELFKEAAGLDPDAKKMMRRETGDLVSCKEMAEYQYARTFIATFGLIDFGPIERYIKTHPSGKLLKDAYLELARRTRITDEEGRALYDLIVDRFPDDPDILSNYVEQVLQFTGAPKSSPFFDNGLDLAERTLDIYPSVTPAQVARNLAQLYSFKEDFTRAEETYGPDFLAGQAKSWASDLLSFAEFWLNQKQNSEESEAAIEKALLLSSKDAEVRRRAAGLYHAQLRNPGKAREVYGPEFLGNIRTNAQGLYDYFKFWMTLGDNQESALGALDMLWDLKPDTVYYRIGAAAVFLRLKMETRSLAVFGPDFAANRGDDPPALYEYGMFWARNGSNLESALPALVTALRKSPRSWTDHWQAAELLVRLNKPESALEVFGPEYLSNIEDDASALCRYASFWIEKGSNRESSLAALETASGLDTLRVFERNRAARIYLDAGMPERAEAIFGPPYYKTLTDDALALLYYASFWGYQNKYLDTALEAAERGCKLDKESPRQWATLARVLLSFNRLEEALAALDKAVGLEKSQEAKDRHEPMRKQIRDALERRKNG